jgi:hypothetical protein
MGLCKGLRAMARKLNALNKTRVAALRVTYAWRNQFWPLYLGAMVQMGTMQAPVVVV